MLDCQKHLFDLGDDVVYLNGAYMSPQLKSVEAAGLQGLRMKNRPHQVSIQDFFQPVEDLKAAFAELIHIAENQRIAIRVAPHVYNTKADFDALVKCFRAAK